VTVLIIGGGICCLGAALLLARRPIREWVFASVAHRQQLLELVR